MPELSVALLCLVAAATWYVRHTRDRATRARELAGVRFHGDYVELPDGPVRYRLRGRSADPVVLMVGGLTTTMEYFDHAASALITAGYRTLQFDLYGRGGSARPPYMKHDRASYRAQIDALLDALQLDEPLFVIGQSLGGGIAASYAAMRPTRVRALSLHASAGFLARPPFSLAVVRAPCLGSALFRAFGLRSILAGVDRHFHDPVALAAQAELLRQTIRDSARIAGYEQSILSTLRHFPLEDLQEDFRALGRAGVPVQIVWGQDDRVIPLQHAHVLLGWLGRKAQLVTFERVGHVPLLESPERVLAAVRSFFDARRTGSGASAPSAYTRADGERSRGA